MVRRFAAIVLGVLVLSPAATAQETANAIIACQVRRVDATYRNPQNTDELRVIEPRLDVVIGFTAVDSTVDVDGIRLFDPARVLGGYQIAELSWNPQTRGFLVRTAEAGEGAVSLVISGPEAGMTTLAATAVRTNEAAIRSPLAYMFLGRCGVMPTANLSADFDRYVASIGSAQ